MSQQETLVDSYEAQLLKDLNKYLFPLEKVAVNLRDDLFDGSLLLELLENAKVFKVAGFFKKEIGPLTAEQVANNHTLLCDVLNKHTKHHSSRVNFEHRELMNGNELEVVRLVLCMLDAKVVKPPVPGDESREEEKPTIQSEFLLQWINFHLSKIDLKAKDLDHDLHDGFLLLHLINIISENPVSDFHSRVFKDVAIENHVLIAQNRDKIQQWLKENGEGIFPSEFESLLNTIVWKLVSISLGVGKIGESTEARIESAKKVFENLGIPFFFEKMQEKNMETDVVLVASIFKDQLDSAKAGDQVKKITKWVAPPQRYMTTRNLDKKILEEGVLRIFLSSTFRDMQRERDQFFKNGAPKLITLAKSKGLELVFIDLRWGLTAEESGDGLVVIRCCDSIKKCAYFVCFLGARYGWVPDSSKTELNKQERLEDLKKTKPSATMQDIWVEWHSTTNKQYPFLDDMPGLSVTEYEIQYAALTDNPACSRVFFYFRDEKFAIENALTEEDRKLYAWETDGDFKLSAEEKQKALQSQNELKAKITSKFGAVTYQGPENFCDLVTSHLSFAIDKDFSGRQVREPEDQAHHQFMQHRLAGFGGRRELLRKIESDVIDQLQSEESQIIVLAAESGIGKSSLMAATVRKLNTNHPDTNIIFHFVGCTNLSNYVESISIRFWKCVIESNASLDIESTETINKIDFQKEGIQGLFKFVETHLANHKFVFLIDAINQLHPSQDTPVPNLLVWLPKKTPKNVALVVSTIDTHESCKTIQSLALPSIPVTKLTNEEIKQSAESFLDRYDKKVNSQQMQLILDDSHDTGHPLYLRLFLEEVRIFGVYERLTEEILKLLETDGVISLYNLIITRWEAKFNKEGVKMVETAMKVLYVSRIGLSEGDLDKYINEKIGVAFNLAEWKTFFFTLIESLFVRNGRYMYFHQLLFEAVKHRFLENEELLRAAQKEYAMWLFGQYSNVSDSDGELVAEICYQLLHGECFEELLEYLKNDHVVESMLRGRYRYEFFNCWRKIHEKGTGSYKDAYKSLVQSISNVGDLLVGFFLEIFESNYLVSQIPVRLNKRTSEDSKASDYLALGRVYKNMLRWEEALDYLERCLKIKIYLNKEDESLAALFDEIGEVYMQQDRLVESQDQFIASLNLRIQLFGEFDLRVAESQDNIGLLKLNQKSLTEAKEYFVKAKEIRSKGVGKDHPLMAKSLTNLAKLDIQHGRLIEALDGLKAAKSIYESSLGSGHPSVASVTQLVAQIYEDQNENKNALQSYGKALNIFRDSVGENHKDTIITIEKMGNIHHSIKNYSEALVTYNKVLEIRKRTLGNSHADVATALENVGRTNFELERTDQVAEFIVPSVEIRYHLGLNCSIKNKEQCSKIALLMKEKNYKKEAIYLYCESQGYESSDAWVVCQDLNQQLNQEKKHKDAIDFWIHLRQLYLNNLSSIHNRVIQIEHILAKHQENVDISAAMESYLRVVKIYGEKNLMESWDAWSICESVDKVLNSAEEHQELVTFWTEMRDLFQEKLGWIHARTLLCCERLSFYLKETGQNKSPIELTKVADFIKEETGTQINAEEFQFENVSVLLFSIVYSSRTDVTKAKAASTAITLLNFINVPFSGLDLSGVRIPNANLTRSIVDGTNFTSADLSGVKLNHSYLGSCILNESNMQSARFGLLKSLLLGPKGYVSSVCGVKGPNGECWLACGDKFDKHIRIFDVSTGLELKAIHRDVFSINCVCSVDGVNGANWLASADSSSIVRLWDTITGSEIKALKGHSSEVKALCHFKGPNDENWLASGSGDKTIRIWDIASGSEIRTLKGHIGDVISICSVKGPNGECWLASGSGYVMSGEDNTIRIWDVSTGKDIKILRGHADYINSVCSVKGPNGEKWLASGSGYEYGKGDNTIRIWDLATGVEIKRLTGHTGPIQSICSIQGPSGECWLASVGLDKSLIVWDIMNFKEVKRLGASKSPILSLCTINGPNNECWLVSGSQDHTIHIWDSDADMELKANFGHKGAVHDMCWTEETDGESLLVTSGDDKTIRSWDLTTYSEKKTIQGHTGPVYSVCKLKGPNGERWLASGSGDKSVCVWDLLTGKKIKVLNDHTDAVKSVCSVDGPNGEYWLASGGGDIYGKKDNKIRLWNIATGQVLKTLDGHSNAVHCLCSVEGHNGNLLLASGSYTEVVLWDVVTGNRIRTLYGQTGHAAAIRRLRGPNSENWLISISDSNALRTWDIDNGAEILQGVKSEFSCNKNGQLVRKSQPDIVLAHFENAADAGQILSPGRLLDVYVTSVMELREIKGGDIQIKNVNALSCYNKSLLLHLGAASFDVAFKGHCDKGKFTKFQAEMIAKCYIEGWGVEKSDEAAATWFGKALDYESLLSQSRKGSVFAFKELLRISEEKDHRGQFKHILSLKYVSQCYFEGLGVEKDAKKSIEYLEKALDFDTLKLHAKNGLKEAFEALVRYSQEVEYGRSKHPVAVKFTAECYLEGWGTEKDSKTAMHTLGKGLAFAILKEYARHGSKDAGNTLIKYAAEKEYGTYGKAKYPVAAISLAECHAEGWGMEKNWAKVIEHLIVADNFDLLKQYLQRGSKEAFNELLKAPEYEKSAASFIAECYVEGWSVEKSEYWASYWKSVVSGKGFDLEFFKKAAQQGSHEAFTVLCKIADKFEYVSITRKQKYPEACHIVADCYAYGWGVEIDWKQVINYLTLIDSFELIKGYIQNGSSEVFQIISTIAQEKAKKYESSNPHAAIVAECYIEGWIVEKSWAKAIEHFVMANDFKLLKQHLRSGSKEAFAELLKVPEYEKSAASFIAECYVEGWSVEKSEYWASYWKSVVTGKGFDLEFFKKAAQQGSHEAFTVLCKIADKFEYVGTTRKQTYPEACLIVADCHAHGWGVVKLQQ